MEGSPMLAGRGFADGGGAEPQGTSRVPAERVLRVRGAGSVSFAHGGGAEPQGNERSEVVRGEAP